MRDANLKSSIKFYILLFAALFAVMGHSHIATAGQESVPSANTVNDGPDIVLLVLPDVGMSTRIGLAYSKMVPHSQVRTAVKHLSDLSGWQVASDLVILDGSIHPDRTKEYPLTTTAMFTLNNAPQVHNFSPVLMPYMRAFQEWNRIEILYHLPEMNPFRGPEHIDSEFYSLLLNKTQGVYRYEIQMKVHKGVLPEPLELIRTSQAVPSPKNSVETKTATQSLISIPMVLVIVGALISGGVGVYLVYVRRTITVHER